mmetsp:Transcript_7585/g.990  ORF Transcript_7585/g.990 Transcript_7585/m.990 type:complete len:95 (+) Transcript_7585:140-424(+)
MFFVSSFLSLYELPYDFYPVSVWWFMLTTMSMYTYKSYKELCFRCIIGYLLTLASIYTGICAMESPPYFTIFMYFVVITLSLVITALNMPTKVN